MENPDEKMKPSSFLTVTVPLLAANINPGAVARAFKVAIRVLVDNVGPVQCYLAFAVADVCSSDGTPTAATFRLAPGKERVFVLAPGQTLYASAAGAGGVLTTAVSDAIPSDRT